MLQQGELLCLQPGYRVSDVRRDNALGRFTQTRNGVAKTFDLPTLDLPLHLRQILCDPAFKPSDLFQFPRRIRDQSPHLSEILRDLRLGLLIRGKIGVVAGDHKSGQRGLYIEGKLQSFVELRDNTECALFQADCILHCRGVLIERHPEHRHHDNDEEKDQGQFSLGPHSIVDFGF